jgi:hypothetical protein
MSDGRRRRATSVDEVPRGPDAAVNVHPASDLVNMASRPRNRHVDATGECAGEPADGEQDVRGLVETGLADEFEQFVSQVPPRLRRRLRGQARAPLSCGQPP